MSDDPDHGAPPPPPPSPPTGWTPPGGGPPPAWQPPPGPLPPPSGQWGPGGWQGQSPVPAPPRTPPPSSSKARVVVAIIAVVALLAVAAGAGAFLLTRDDDDGDMAGSPTTTEEEPTTEPPTTEAPAGDPSQDDLEALVAELSAFVEEERELTFLRPVEIEPLDDEAFEARLLEDAEDDIEELETVEAVWRALNFIGPDVVLLDALQQFRGEAVLGFYDPETEELVVRGVAPTPYTRITIVHELVHALDDQHFELHRPDLDEADDETGYAFSALLEGNAVRIEDRYRESLPDEEREEADREEEAFRQNIDLTDVPEILANILSFPYVIGPQLAELIADDGGERAVDEALLDPPTTTEQLLDPTAYFEDEGAAQVPPPPAEGEVIDEGAVGQWSLLLLLAEELPVRTSQQAAQGWGGDWSVVWDDGDQTCIRARIVMDTPRDLEEITGALRDWADGHGDAEVEADAEGVTFTACG